MAALRSNMDGWQEGLWVRREVQRGRRMLALVWGSGEGVQGPDVLTPSTNG